MINFLTGLFLSTLFISFLLILEYVTRKNKYSEEFTRRIAHIVSGLFAIIMASVLYPGIFILFVLIFLIIITVSFRRKFFSSIHKVKRKTYGELFLPLGILAALLISGGPNMGFYCSILVLTFADPLAGIVCDIKLSYEKVFLNSLVFFIVTTIILFSFIFLPPITLIIIALLLTLTEKFSPYGLDNLTIPLAASFFLRFVF